MTAMTTAPNHPLWKRALAATLDVLTVHTIGGWALQLTLGSRPFPPTSSGTTITFATSGVGGFSLEGWPAIALIMLIIAYFVVLRRTGGTVFQRIFRINSSKVQPDRIEP